MLKKPPFRFTFPTQCPIYSPNPLILCEHFRQLVWFRCCGPFLGILSE
jgi:hypothetical protein